MNGKLNSSKKKEAGHLIRPLLNTVCIIYGKCNWQRIRAAVPVGCIPTPFCYSVTVYINFIYQLCYAASHTANNKSEVSFSSDTIIVEATSSRISSKRLIIAPTQPASSYHAMLCYKCVGSRAFVKVTY